MMLTMMMVLGRDVVDFDDDDNYDEVNIMMINI